MRKAHHSKLVLTLALFGAVASTFAAKSLRNNIPVTPWPMFQRFGHHEGDGCGTINSPTFSTLFTGSSPIAGAAAFSYENAVPGLEPHLYFGDNGGHVHSINLSTGVDTPYTTGSGKSIISAPCVGKNYDGTDNYIFVGSEDKYLYIFDWDVNQNLSLVTKLVTGGAIQTSPVQEPTGLVYVGSTDDKLYACDLSSSPIAFTWTFTTGGPIHSSPALFPFNPGPSGGLTAYGVFFGSDDKKVYSLVPSTGVEQWSYTTSGLVRSSPAIRTISSLSEDVLFVGSDDHYVYAINASTGALIWKKLLPNKVESSPAISADTTTVYVGCDDDKLYALNSQTGAINWSYATSGIVRSSPVIDYDGNIVFGSNDDNIYELTSAGVLVGTAPFSTGGLVTASGAIRVPAGDLCTTTGTLVIGSQDGNLYELTGN